MCISNLIMSIFTGLSIILLIYFPLLCKTLNFIAKLKNVYKQYTCECLAISAQIIILFIAIFSEFCSIICKDAANIFLSIFATIFTIHTALWALMSGILDKNYMGIYYSDFFLNLAPYIYKQKRVIITSLIMMFAA